MFCAGVENGDLVDDSWFRTLGWAVAEVVASDPNSLPAAGLVVAFELPGEPLVVEGVASDPNSPLPVTVVLAGDPNSPPAEPAGLAVAFELPGEP